jgi:hemin uptake protein HemP
MDSLRNVQFVLVAGPNVSAIDVTKGTFPITIRIGDKEYLLLKTRLGNLCLNGKDKDK